MAKAFTRVLLSLVGLASCTSEPDTSTAVQDPVPGNVVQREPQAIPVPESPLNRRDILLATFEAGSAVATGAEHQKQTQLQGRRFEFRIRFGCDRPVATLAPEQTGWSYDEVTRTLRVQAVPDIDLANSIVGGAVPEGIEAAEGIWIKRPWILGASCPTRPVQDPSPSHWNVGLVQFFNSSDTRIDRRAERPYVAVTKLSADEKPPQGGFDLVLTGKLDASGEKNVINCVETSSSQPPTCLVSIRLERVALERADNSATLAQWERG